MKKMLLSTLVVIGGVSAVSANAATNQVMCTLEYMPVCGTVVENGQIVQKTFGNKCQAGVANATNLTEGECAPPLTGGDSDIHGCKASAGYEWDETLAQCIRPFDSEAIVDWAYATRLTRFDTVADFKYDLNMSRQEAAAFAVRAGERLFAKDYQSAVKTCNTTFADAKDIDSNLNVDVKASCGMGLFLGNNGKFLPKQSLTRAEALMVLIRMIDGKTYTNLTAYANRANELGLTFANLHEFDTPMTRGDFVEWIRIVANTTTKKTPMNDKNLIGTWNLQNVTGFSGAEISKLGATLTFDQKRVGAKICNTMGGEYSATGGRISAPQIMSTLMYCEGTPSKVESAFVLDGAKYVVTSTASPSGANIVNLVLTTKNNIVFTFSMSGTAPTPSAKSIIGNWYLVGYNTLGYADTKKAGYQTITLDITDKSLSTKFCNQMNGDYTLSGTTLKTTGMMSTRMACADTTLMQMESAFGALDGASVERNTINYLVATSEPSEILTLKTKAGNTFTFGKK